MICALRSLLAAIVAVAIALTTQAASGENLIQLEKYAGKLRQISVQIGGAERKFLFDSGGGHTVISPGVAAALGCNPAGRILGFRMNGERFETPKCENVRFTIGPFASQGETAGVFDLMSMLPKDFPRLDGVVSLATFEGRAFALDLSANRMVIDPALRSGQFFPCRVATGIDGADTTLFAGVMRLGSWFWLEVDSGNLDAVRIAPHASHAFGLDTQAPEPRVINLALGDGRATKAEARVVDLIHDGALSAAFLEQGVLYADLKGRPRCSWALH